MLRAIPIVVQCAIIAIIAIVALCAFTSMSCLSSLLPCAIDDECGAGEFCSDGFCADGDGGEGEGEGQEGEGEGVGEGEGEREVESHPLRGAPCTDVGAVAVADTGLSCSLFETLEEPCASNVDCGDPTAPHCVDPGPGPAFCSSNATLTRSICGAAGGGADDVTDVTDLGASCVNGHALFRAAANCATSSGPGVSEVGGDLVIRVNHGQGDPEPPCLNLQFLSTNMTVLGGNYFLGRDPNVTELSSAQPPLAALRFFELTAVLGDFSIEGSQAAVSNAAFEVKHIGGDLRFVDDPALEDVDFRFLDRVGGDVVIDNTPVLDLLRLPLLGAVGGDVVIRNAPNLKRCTLEALFAAVDVSGTVTIEGVNDDATCP